MALFDVRGDPLYKNGSGSSVLGLFLDHLGGLLQKPELV
jgi:hypothetical protein